MSLSPLYYTENKSDISMKEYNGKPLSPEKFITIFFYHSTVGHYFTCWKNASNLKNVSHYQHDNNFA